MYIQTQLRTGIELESWSRDSAYTTTQFTIYGISPDSIRIVSPTIPRGRSIAKSDFATVHNFWSDYRAGKVSRAKMATLSHNTSYIFGILKWLEDEAKGESNSA